MPAERGQKRKIEVPDDLPWIPLQIIEWDIKRKAPNRQQDEGIPLELPLEDPFRVPESDYDIRKNLFEINYDISNDRRIGYSR